VATVQLGGRVAAVLGVLHAALTNYVVVVTANHYWLDGIVAAVFLAVVLAVQAWFRRQRSTVSEPEVPTPIAVTS